MVFIYVNSCLLHEFYLIRTYMQCFRQLNFPETFGPHDCCVSNRLWKNYCCCYIMYSHVVMKGDINIYVMKTDLINNKKQQLSKHLFLPFFPRELEPFLRVRRCS